jgi:biopolymer transport protein ExbD
MAFLHRGFLKSANRPNNFYCKFHPAPYLGLAIALFCFFMLGAPSSHGGVPVELVKSAHAHSFSLATREDAIRVGITRDDSIYFRNHKVATGDLPNRIHDSVLNGAEKRVYLQVDFHVPYSDVEQVIDQVRLAGVQNLSFLTK